MKRKNAVRLGLIALAAALMAVGIASGDVRAVMQKAVLICYECIGIG